MAHGKVTRATFLRGAAVGAGGIMIGGLAACGSDSSSGSGSTTGGKPQRGGVLQFAVTDASESEALDPLPAVNQHHALYSSLIWEYLVGVDDEYRPQPHLATKWSSTPDASQWTFELRPDVKWQDGKPLTSKDVAWTIKRILDEKNGSPSFSSFSEVLDASGLDTSDPHVLVARLKRPDALFPQLFIFDGTEIVQDGWEPDGKPANAVGTGPFIAKRFKPGEGFEVVKNPDYWGGAPYLDGARSVVIADPASKLQSVLSGPSHVTDNVTPANIKSTESFPVDLIRINDFYITYFTMDTTQKPFDNNDVRMAFKLAADREKILNIAFAGYGTQGNDSSAPVGSPWVPDSAARRRDVAQAKELLAKAGYPDGLDIELVTADILGGFSDAAVVYAASAKEAGINISIKQAPIDTYFDQIWLKKPFYVDYLGALQPLLALQLSFVPDAPYNETFLANSKAAEYVERGLKEIDQAKQDAITTEAMQWQSDNEGIITTGFLDKLKIQKKEVRGATYSKNGQGDYSKAWLEA
ncbi:MAG TPA: ABC transporter substrate-binding protein [Solirubrobacterales bacterium]